MDPNATLREIRELCQKSVLEVEDWLRLTELFEALDTWLSQGNFLPVAWQR